MASRAADDLVPAPAPPPGPDDLVPSPVHADGGHSPLLAVTRALLRGLTSLSPLPVGRARLLWVRGRPAGRAVAEAYVVGWVLVLTLGLVFADTEAGPYLVGLALFRYGDLVTTRAVVLLDPVGLRLGDPRRALALLGLHVVELTLITGTVFRWRLGERLGSAFVTGFDVVTFQWPARYGGNWLEVTRVLAGAGVILVAVSVIGIVSRIMRERP